MINEDLLEGHAYETAFWMAGVYDPNYPIHFLGELAAEVSTKLRGMAIFHLLGQGKANSYYHNLNRSGVVRSRYLARCLAEQALEDHFRTSGRCLPLFDTIAAGNFALAAQIVDLSPNGFMAGHEYEDDFCYAQIVHNLLTNGRNPSPGNSSEALLGRFAHYLDGTETGRFLVAKALVERDQAGFESAFEQLLSDRESEIAADIKRGQIESALVVAQRRVFVEGLAMLRLAQRAGIETVQEYLFCPSIARIPMTEPYPEE